MSRRNGRAEPASCQFCRSKKLRCNRVHPCSNCEARNVACHFLVPPLRNPGHRSPESHRDPQIISRLERLESIVLPQGTANEEHSSSQSNVIFTHYQEDGSQYKDLHTLENVGVREDSVVSSLSDDLTFCIRSMNDILDLLGGSQDASLASGARPRTLVTFPPYETAVTLFACFENNVEHMCQVLDLPSVRSFMKSFYTRIGQGESVPPGQAALLLALFALSVYFYQPIGMAKPVAGRHETTGLSKYWSRGALDVLEHSRRNTSGTLEDVQALILMSYVTYHLDGFAARYRNLLATAISMARDLGLHQLDSDDCSLTNLMNDSPDIRTLIDQEVKRRVYWHLVSADWTQSTMSGPQEGTYFINPNHVQVNLPRDYDEEGNVPNNGGKSLADAPPTGVTFLLARIRLAHFSREYTDAIPLDTRKLIGAPYERIVSLDEKLGHFFTELPFFFRQDEESRQQSRHLEAVYKKVPMMRYCILAAAHTIRCRLHQKFLIRLSSNPRYEYSRRACLESARAVIQLYEEPKSDDNSLSILEMARMAMAVYYTHLALVIQVMDLCFNKTKSDHDERKRELFVTLQKLEGARSISPLLNRSLDSLVEVLRKHQVQADWTSSTGDYQNHGGNPVTLEDGEMDALQNSTGMGEGSIPITPSINEFWQNVNQFDMEFDSATWDNFFSNLDSRPI